MSTPVTCRLELAEINKLQRIMASKGLKNNSQTIKHLVQNYESDGKETKQINKFSDRLEKKIDDLDKKFIEFKSLSENHSSDTLKLIDIMSNVLIRLTDSQPIIIKREMEGN